MKGKITIAAILLGIFCQGVIAQPLVYNQENTGAACAPPPLPPITGLSPIIPLPDPFIWADGSGRSTNFADWECRRNEIRQQIENYEIGIKPPKPDNVTAVYTPAANPATGGTLVVTVTRNGQTMTLTSAVAFPTSGGSGPYPAMIGMNSPTGGIPDSLFNNRGIARITYNHDNVTTYGNPALTNPFYRLYPEYNLDNHGQYAAWIWGVSRLIDGLELVQASLPIRLDRLAVAGCSYAGKMALFSGAFDERIALTIALESGGGGAPAWRISHNLEPAGSVEKIDNTDYRWFKNDMQDFSGDNVYKLPHDHHELMAMVAPRALLVTSNSSQTWLSSQAVYISSRAAKSVYNTLGISERMGFVIDTDHGHCAIPASQVPAIRAFIDKFMVGRTDVITDTVTVNSYPNVDYERWYKWWGTGRPVLPPLDGTTAPLEDKKIWQEAECAIVGSDWNTMTDAEASQEKYIVAKDGTSSPDAPPSNPSALTVFSFAVDSAANYSVQARVNQGGGDFSYWVKLDNGAFEEASNQLVTNPGFENGLTGWSRGNWFWGTESVETNAANVHSGSQSLKVVTPFGVPGLQWAVQYKSTEFPTTIGKQYAISYWVKALTAGGSIRLSTGPTNAQYQADQTIGTAWQKITWTITANLSSTNIFFDLGQAGNTYYIDDVSVTEVGSIDWKWVKLKNAALSIGQHTVTIANKAGAAQLDKLYVSTSASLPNGKGAAGTNCPCPQLGSTLFVNVAINNSSSTGASWGCAMPSLSTAISYANTHPEVTAIWVAKGTYQPGNTRASSFAITRSNLSILGGFDGSETDATASNPSINRTILSGDIGISGDMSDNSYHTLLIHDLPAQGTLEINGFEVRDGNAANALADKGAAAYLYNNHPKSKIIFNHMTFAGNMAAHGGALFFDKTNAQVMDSYFGANKATMGGAVYSSFSAPVFVHSVFEDNMASQAGGVYYGNYGNGSFNKSAFAYNSSSQMGGAVYTDQEDAMITNSVFVSNQSAQGAAVYLDHNSNLSSVNNTFYGNAASVNGGALVIGGANSKAGVSNNIFYANTKQGSMSTAGADIASLTIPAKMQSSFANNMLQTNTLVPADNGSNIVNNLRGDNPMFVNAPIPGGGDLLWGTTDDGLQLKMGSPAINSGYNAAASNAGLTEDIMDNDRMCGVVDRGAYEAACDESAQPITRNSTPQIKSLPVSGNGLVANPFNSDLQIRYTGTEKCAASIYDGNGRVVVLGRSISQGVNHVDASSWNRGMYQVMLVTQSGKQMLFKAMKL